MSHHKHHCEVRDVIVRKHNVVLSIMVSLCFVFSSSVQASSLRAGLLKAQDYIDKEYYVLLLGFRFFLPEIVELDLSDNGSFSLKSDLWDEAAEGTYENNILLVKGSGTTGNFYDVDFEEYIVMDYTFTGLPVGFQDFFILGTGTRDIILEDGSVIFEPFIFEGPGF